MKFEDLTLEEAERILTDDTAARQYERDVLYPGPSMLTEDEVKAIERVVDKYCCGHEPLSIRFAEFIQQRRASILDSVDEFRLAAARRGRPRSDEKTSEDREDVTFVFAEDKCSDNMSAWRAELTVSAIADAESLLPIFITRNGEKVKSGIFRIAGIALPITDGETQIPFGLFLAGMREPKVELVSENGEVTIGSLVFF